MSTGVWLGRIIAICGISATGFGFVYGSVFGNEELIPWGFHVLEKENTMQILLIAVALGAVLGGWVIDAYGAQAGFGVSLAAGSVMLLVAVLGYRLLQRSTTVRPSL